jgi:hypothetical protein
MAVAGTAAVGRNTDGNTGSDGGGKADRNTGSDSGGKADGNTGSDSGGNIGSDSDRKGSES